MKGMKTFGAVATSVLMVAGATTAFAATVEEGPSEVASVQKGAQGAQLAGAQRSQAIEGSFSFSQEALTPNADIAGTFAKAAASLCSDLPSYGATKVATAVTFSVRGDVMDAYVAEVADGAESSLTMGCACSTNGPGGGAIAGAEVSGISVAEVARMLSAA